MTHSVLLIAKNNSKLDFINNLFGPMTLVNKKVKYCINSLNYVDSIIFYSFNTRKDAYAILSANVHLNFIRFMTAHFI